MINHGGRANYYGRGRRGSEGGAAADRVRPGVISGIADGWDGIHAISDPFHRPLLPPSPLLFPLVASRVPHPKLWALLRPPRPNYTDKGFNCYGDGGGGGSGVAITVSQRRANFRGWL